MIPEAESLISFIDAVEDLLSKTPPTTPLSKILSQIRGPILQMREELEALESDGGAFEAALRIESLEAKIKLLNVECEEWLDMFKASEAEIKRLRANQKDATQ
jgi:hypothetical protein